MGPDSSSGPRGPLLPATFGRYTLLERIGGGGMATVYRASLSGVGGFEKEVAVKVIRHELAEDPQFAQMFLDEARLSARLNHANIVQTFDFGEEEGLHFLAMELVHGRTLAALLKICKAKGIRLGLGPSLRVAAELARALDYAHRLVDIEGRSLGIVHRDVSPQNVLVSREGEVKLADFGIAKAVLRSHVTQPGKVRGKCAYMAPEQIRGQELDGRADVFALGVVLWESLSGRSLFEGSSDAAVLHQVLEKEILPPSWFAAEVPPEVDRLVMRLLSREVQERPDSGQAARALSELIWNLVRSEAEVDLAELQRRLSSGTAVHEPPGFPAREGAACAGSQEGRAAPAQGTTMRELHPAATDQATSPAEEKDRGGGEVGWGGQDPAPSSPEEVGGSAGATPPIEILLSPDAETLVPEERAREPEGSAATTAPLRAGGEQRQRWLRWAGALVAAAVVGGLAGRALFQWGPDPLAAMVARGGKLPEEAQAAVSEGPALARRSAPGGERAMAAASPLGTVPSPPAAPTPGAAPPGGVPPADEQRRPIRGSEALHGGVATDEATARPPLLLAGAERSGSGPESQGFVGVLLWGGTTPAPPRGSSASHQRQPRRRAASAARPQPREGRAQPPRSAGAPVAAAAPAAPRKPAAPPPDPIPPGELAVSSMLEGATVVSIDGVPARTLGRRSPAKLTLSAGRHRVSFLHEESGMFCGVIAEIESGKMLALNADANGVGILKGNVRTPIPCTERR